MLPAYCSAPCARKPLIARREIRACRCRMAPRVEVGQEALGSIDHSVGPPRKGHAA